MRVRQPHQGRVGRHVLRDPPRVVDPCCLQSASFHAHVGDAGGQRIRMPAARRGSPGRWASSQARRPAYISTAPPPGCTHGGCGRADAGLSLRSLNKGARRRTRCQRTCSWRAGIRPAAPARSIPERCSRHRRPPGPPACAGGVPGRDALPHVVNGCRQAALCSVPHRSRSRATSVPDDSSSV